MAAFHRGEITLRKLRVLIEKLPPGNPVYWHLTEGRKWTPEDQLAWMSTWAVSVAASALAGTKKGDSIFKNMPKYPWSEKDEGMSRLGSLKGVKQEDVLDYLDSL